MARFDRAPDIRRLEAPSTIDRIGCIHLPVKAGKRE